MAFSETPSPETYRPPGVLALILPVHCTGHSVLESSSSPPASSDRCSAILGGPVTAGLDSQNSLQPDHSVSPQSLQPNSNTKLFTKGQEDWYSKHIKKSSTFVSLLFKTFKYLPIIFKMKWELLGFAHIAIQALASVLSAQPFEPLQSQNHGGSKDSRQTPKGFALCGLCLLTLTVFRMNPEKK